MLTTTTPPLHHSTTTPRSDGGYVFDENASLTGEGVLEFTAGTGHELRPDQVPPLVTVSGRAVVTFAGDSFSLGRGLTVAVSGCRPACLGLLVFSPFARSRGMVCS